MNLSIDPDELKPVIVAVVEQTIAAIEQRDAMLDGQQLAFAEAEAAAKIGVRAHVLRDARHRGEIRGKKVGRFIVYELCELRAFLARDREECSR